MYKEQMNQIDLYDINIWCGGEGFLTITAYQLQEDKEGKYATDTSKYLFLNVPMDEKHHEVIAYLLDSEEWEEQDWEDHDYWNTTNYLLEGETPFMIKVWVRSLPYYTPKKVEVH
jgi:hypothetical protein